MPDRSASPPRRRRRRLLAAAATAVLGGLAAAAVTRRRGAGGWATGEDPCGPEGIALPPGASRTVTTDDGAALDVVVAGPEDGPTVVLPHCWTGTKEIWGPVARRLVAGGHRVVLYDQRGHGGSTVGTGAMTTDRLGEDLLAVLDAVGGTDLVLAGHSMGGMTIQALAVGHPEVIRERVRGIALVATAAHVAPLALPSLLVDRFLGDAATARIGRRGLAVTRGAVGVAAHKAHVQATYDAFAATPGAVRSGFLVAMTGMDYRKGLGTIDVPTKVLVGSHDRLTPVRRARLLADRIPDAELRVLPDLGHMLPLEAPDVVAAAIVELVDRTAVAA